MPGYTRWKFQGQYYQLVGILPRISLLGSCWEPFCHFIKAKEKCAFQAELRQVRTSEAWDYKMRCTGAQDYGLKVLLTLVERTDAFGMGRNVLCPFSKLFLLACSLIFQDTVKYIKSRRIKLLTAIVLTGQPSQFLIIFSESSFLSFL